jgi:hypothetical protein
LGEEQGIRVNVNLPWSQLAKKRTDDDKPCVIVRVAAGMVGD